MSNSGRGVSLFLTRPVFRCGGVSMFSCNTVDSCGIGVKMFSWNFLNSVGIGVNCGNTILCGCGG